MDPDKVKAGIMELWKKTFHDSNEYISVVFNNYFDKSLYVYREADDKVIASILGIPYDFYFGDIHLKGLYLCGIATEPHHRRKGIMTDLLEEIEEKAKDEYDFSFLIPSDETKRIIYSGKGFYNAIYKVYEYYTALHDFKAEFDSTLYFFDDHIKKLKTDLFESLKIVKLSDNIELYGKKIISYISDYESAARRYLHLRHTTEDILTAMEDNSLSRGEVFISLDKSGEVTCVMFTEPAADGRIKIYAQFCNDACSYFKVLDGIKRFFAEMSLTVLRFPEEVKGAKLWSETSVVGNPDGEALESLVGIETRVFYSADHAHPYGMVKVHNLDNFIRMLASLRRDVSFKIILKGYKENILIEVKNGNYSLQKIEEPLEQYRKSHKISTVLYEEDFMEILFRKKRKDDIIMEAFEIPRLPINVSLMLD